jgi:hypothetical protein
MITYAFLGFMTAIIVMLIVAIIWGRAKDSVQRWSYNLTRESNLQLRDTELKLESILRGQERLERAINAQTNTLSDLRSRVAGHKTAS